MDAPRVEVNLAVRWDDLPTAARIKLLAELGLEVPNPRIHCEEQESEN